MPVANEESTMEKILNEILSLPFIERYIYQTEALYLLFKLRENEARIWKKQSI